MNMNFDMCDDSPRGSECAMNRWVDPHAVKALQMLVLMGRRSQSTYSIETLDANEGCDSSSISVSLREQFVLPEDILTQCIPRFLHFDAPIPGIIYVFGGRASKVLEPEHYLNTAECYDTFRNEWIPLPPMNSKRVGASSIVGNDGRVYIVGGYAKHPDKPLASGECFNPRTGEWRSICDMSQGRFGHSIASCGKYLFVLGGDSRRNLVSGIERYDTELDEWKSVGLLPRPVAGGRSLERNGKLYLIGGDIGSSPLSFTSTIRIYDPASNSWEVLETSLSQGRSATACTWLSEGSSEIAVIGGYAAENDTFFELKTSEIIQTDPVSGTNIANGRIIPPLPESRAGARSVTIGTKIYVIGGETPDFQSEQVHGENEQSPLSGLFGTINPHQRASNIREVLLQALQQRLTQAARNTNPNAMEDDLTLRLPPATRIAGGIVPTERKAHPVVAVFDTSKWEWEKDTPLMTTARTAASVCVGKGYPTSFSWNNEKRWATEKRYSRIPCVEDAISPRRPQAASG